MNALLLSLFFQVSFQTLLIHYPLEFQGEWFSPAFMKPGRKDFNITGELAVAFPSDGCNPSNKEDLKGRIVLVSGGSCSHERKLRVMESCGAKALVMTTVDNFGPAFLETFYKDGSSIKELSIEGVCIQSVVGNKLIKAMENFPLKSIIVTLTPDSNPWSDFAQDATSYSWQYIFAIWGFANSLLAILKLIFLIRVKGFRNSVPQLILWFELSGNLEMTLYFAIDPLYFRDIFTALESEVLMTLSFPMKIASNLVVIFWWQEILTLKFTKILPSLNKFNVLFAFLITIYVIFDITFSIVSGLYIPTTSLRSIYVGVYGLTDIYVSLLFLIVGIRLIREIRKFSDFEGDRRRMIYSVMRVMIFCSIAAWIRIAGYIVMETPLFNEWYGFLAAWTLNAAGHLLSGTVQILSIKHKRMRLRNSSISKSSNKREVPE